VGGQVTYTATVSGVLNGATPTGSAVFKDGVATITCEAGSTVSLNGRNVTRFSFAWNAGTSAVTGKAVELTSVRYYVPKDSATLAVITYGIVSNQFDPQGADDIVSTFRWQ